MTDQPLPFIRSLHINEVRHLRDISIKIDQDRPRHLILTGPNGCGKTSVLRFLKDHLEGIPRKEITDIESWPHQIMNAQQSIIEQENTLNRPHPQLPDPLKALALNSIRNSKKLIEDLQNKIDAYKIIVPNIFHLDKMIDLYHEGQFIIAFFDAKRISKISPTDGPKKINFPEICPIDIAEQPTSLASQFLQFLVNQESRSAHLLKKGDTTAVAELEEWMESITNRFRQLFQNDQLNLVYDIDEFDFTIEMPGRETFRLVDNQLSDGFSAATHIIAELLMRMEAKSAGRYDMPGVVLIDEIETHLHIELQKQILPFLTDFFPNIQFIVTTHSPFVLTSLPDAVIFDLESHKREEHFAPLSASTVIEDYFESDLYSAESKRMIDRYKELISMTKLGTEDKEELKKLKEELDELPYEDAPELVAHYQHLKAKGNHK